MSNNLPLNMLIDPKDIVSTTSEHYLN